MEVMAMPMASGHLTLTLWPMLGTDTAEPTPDTGTDMALGTTAKGPLIPRPFSTVNPEGLTFAFSMFAKISRLVHEMALSKFSGNKVFKIVSYIRLISKIHTLFAFKPTVFLKPGCYFISAYGGYGYAYGKRSADSDSEANAWYGYGGVGYGYGYGLGYYGKRSADSDADYYAGLATRFLPATP